MRYPTLSEEQISVPQRTVRAGMYQRSGQAVEPFYGAVIYSPEVADRTHTTLEFMRTGLRIPLPLRALAILVAARKHNLETASEFARTDDIRTSGLDAAVVEALVSGEVPTGMGEDQSLVYDFCTAVTAVGRVKTPLFERTAARFGNDVCLELVTLCGFVIYTAFLLNVTGKKLQP